MALDSPRPRSNGRALTAARLALALLIPALPAAGQEASPAPDHLRYGFTGVIGYGRALGNASDFLDDTGAKGAGPALTGRSSTPWTRSRDASG
jgi:hypothetical protein